jgi:hypothetical protein
MGLSQAIAIVMGRVKGGISTMVKHSPHHPEVKGSSQATTDIKGTVKERELSGSSALFFIPRSRV